MHPAARSRLLLLAAFRLPLAGGLLGRLSCPRPREFGTTSEFRARAEAKGLHVWSPGSAREKVGEVRVSDRHGGRELAVRELAVLRHGREWSGVAVVVNLAPQLPPDVPHRVWGRVLVMGDPELLDRLEALRSGQLPVATRIE